MTWFTSEWLGNIAAMWLFFTGAACGAVALSCAIRLAKGRWADDVLPIAHTATGFFLPSFFILALLVFGAHIWIPGTSTESSNDWLFRALRDLVAAGLVFGAGVRYRRQCRLGSDPSPKETRDAIIYILVYALSLTTWAIDLVMDLHDWPPSTVIPPLYFMGAFLSGIGWISLKVCFMPEKPESSEIRYDLGKLLFAFVIFWGYLIWALYLPAWYGNLPDEVGQLLARWEGGYKTLTIFVLAAILLFPFAFLMAESMKRGRRTLAIGAASIFIGLAGERFLMVLPSLTVTGGGRTLFVSAGTLIGMLSVFWLTTRTTSPSNR